jgi:hypothetical protein
VFAEFGAIAVLAIIALSSASGAFAAIETLQMPELMGPGKPGPISSSAVRSSYAATGTRSL